jgi:hypothetical protein
MTLAQALVTAVIAFIAVDVVIVICLVLDRRRWRLGPNVSRAGGGKSPCPPFDLPSPGDVIISGYSPIAPKHCRQ